MESNNEENNNIEQANEEEQQQVEENEVEEVQDENKEDVEEGQPEQENEENNENVSEYGNNDQEQIIEEEVIGRKRKRNTLSKEKIQNDTLSFIAKLRECASVDKANQKQRKPALERLKFLPKIEKFLANIYYQREFLDTDGLVILQEWLKKNLDGTYPALNQLSTILDILNNMTSITVEHLKKCQIGGYVRDLSKNMKYSKNIIKKANDLIQKWSRLVYGINIDYSDIESENMKYKEIFNNVRKRGGDDDEEEIEEEENEDEDEKKKTNDKDNTSNDIMKEYEIYNHAKIPKKGLFDFTKKPISNIDETKVDEGNKVKYNYFFDGKKKGRKKY